MHPDAATLRQWAEQWHALKLKAMAELRASYTPEQLALLRRANVASHQINLCRMRARWPSGATGKHESLIKWPEAPPRS
jgi:hypothetical protein